MLCVQKRLLKQSLNTKQTDYQKHMKTKIITLSISFFLIFSNIQATITLPSLITNNMVLQQNQLVTIWGWTTNTTETIKVNGSWNTDSVSVTASGGAWKVQLQTPSYGGPYTLCIKGNETIKISNVLIGEVWLASGQSNMEMPVDSISASFRGDLNFRQRIAEANFPTLRMFTVPKVTAITVQEKCGGSWIVCSPSTVGAFSAAAYFFGKTLLDSLHIPIGILHSSWGGTNAESWFNKSILLNNPLLKNYAGTDAGLRYNSMIYPLINYSIKGSIWYQGENNKGRAAVYKETMTELIKNWRSDWKAEFPFYFTQIVPYSQNGLSSNTLREAQLQTLSVAKTGMIVTADFSDLNNIHPRQKEEVGRRLALWALAKDYGKNVVCSGPIYKSMSIVGSKIILQFDYAETGLKFKNATALKYFQMAAEDHYYMPAVATIKGSTVEVTSNFVSSPVAVRMAFSDTEIGNLFNNANLPASLFRTDMLDFTGQHTPKYVSAAGDDAWIGTLELPFATLAKAYDNAIDGDTIYMAAGTYTGAPNLSITKSMTILGEGAGQTIIQGATESLATSTSKTGINRFATLGTAGKSLILNDLTIRNFGWWGLTNGGAILLNNVSDAVGATLTAIRCNFEGGVARYGGAIQVSNANASGTNSFIAEDCYFGENYAMAAITTVVSPPSQTYNQPTNYGAGAINVGAGGLMTLKNCVFYKNGTLDAPITSTDGILCTATTPRAIQWVSTKSAIITNCTFIDNVANGLGSTIVAPAIYFGAVPTYYKFINNILVNNFAAGSTGGVDFQLLSTITASTNPNIFISFKNNLITKKTIDASFTLAASNMVNAAYTKTSAEVAINGGNVPVISTTNSGVKYLSATGTKVLKAAVTDSDVKTTDINGIARGSSFDLGVAQSTTTGFDELKLNETKITVIDHTVKFSLEELSLVSIYNTNGVLLHSEMNNVGMVNLPLKNNGLFLVKILSSKKNETHKILNL